MASRACNLAHRQSRGPSRPRLPLGWWSCRSACPRALGRAHFFGGLVSREGLIHGHKQSKAALTHGANRPPCLNREQHMAKARARKWPHLLVPALLCGLSCTGSIAGEGGGGPGGGG